MSIPFRSTSGDDSHAAAFLRVIRDEAGGYDGALFVMNAKGEPLEFVYYVADSRTDNPVRAFRNAIAHSNWTYRSDFRGLVFWARKSEDPEEALTRFEVLQEDLNFWQALSRTVAYAAYTSLEDVGALRASD